MGFATSVAVVIIFVALLITATIYYPLLLNSYKNLEESKNEKHEIQMEQLNTAIKIINITNSGNIIITVSNNGTTVLNASKSDVLVDGVYTTYTVTPSGLWLPGENAVFTVSGTTYSRIKIVTENGVSAYGG